jgi:hypothetical protein
MAIHNVYVGIVTYRSEIIDVGTELVEMGVQKIWSHVEISTYCSCSCEIAFIIK